MGSEVQAALASGQPLVALESTLIAHGFPYPDNLELAHLAEAEVRRAGAFPATIAIVDGQFVVGLTEAELERVATDQSLPKASIRDLPVLAGLGQSASTTVAATAQIAVWAGIDVFVTGGIGGVHRGFGETLDISADLPALARLPIAVVSSGAKTVLDVPATLEWLETHGVTTVGYQTDSFPGFYRRGTGLPVDIRTDEPATAAQIVRARKSLGLPGAVLIGVPIPEEAAVSEEQFNGWLARAEALLAEAGVKGKAITPFLLDRIHELSEGLTVAAEKALIMRNAQVGAQLAVALKREAERSCSTRPV